VDQLNIDLANATPEEFLKKTKEAYDAKKLTKKQFQSLIASLGIITLV
jgi:hypothetical protein